MHKSLEELDCLKLFWKHHDLFSVLPVSVQLQCARAVHASHHAARFLYISSIEVHNQRQLAQVQVHRMLCQTSVGVPCQASGSQYHCCCVFHLPCMQPTAHMAQSHP
jgi:hypothetical protein